jgi:hypothetical protein
MSISLSTLTTPLTTHVSSAVSGTTNRLTELSIGLHSGLAGLNGGPSPMAICPKAPSGATQPVNEITGYVVWGVIILFSLSLIIGLGAIVAGRIFSMPHASKVGVISLVVVFVAAVAYLVLPGMLDGILGKGCIS